MRAALETFRDILLSLDEGTAALTARYDFATLSLYVALLREARLATGDVTRTASGTVQSDARLTPEGRELAGLVRDEIPWLRVKASLAEVQLPLRLEEVRGILRDWPASER